MAYDEKLAVRIRKIFIDDKITEKKMFGGLCFLHQGNMCCGIVNDTLMLRVGPEQYEKLLRRSHTSEMDFTGRPMKGMIYVSPEGIKTKQTLQKWLNYALDFVNTLPAKPEKKLKAL